MSEAVLEINGLTKRVQKDKKIVQDASFQVKKGEILGLLGPNGAGKTTTIRMIVGLIRKSEGKVFINGHDLDEEGQKCKAEVGAIVENPAFYDYMSGYKNLQQHARMTKGRISEARINEVVELVQLEDAIKDKVKKYSLGMKQRLGVAQALLHKPSLLILDEPTNGLDPKGIRELRDYLRQLANEGISSLVSSHLLSEMQLMCDRVVIMEKGRIIDETIIESLNEANGEVKQHVSFRVKEGQLAKAEDIIAAMDEAEFVKRHNGSVLIVKMDDKQIPELNRRFVSAEIDVFAIELQKTSLEDKFLSLTSRDNIAKHKEVSS